MLENPVLEPVPVSDSAASLPPSTSLSRRAVLGWGAILGTVLVLPKFTTIARADVAYGDVQSLRFLEELARLEANFFARAAISTPADGFSEREASAFNLISRQDSELVRWFKGARRRFHLSDYSAFYTPNKSMSRPMPTYTFGAGSFETRGDLLSMAIMLKETSVGAFHGVVGAARGAEMLQAFAALAGVQGRHLTVLRELAGRDPLVAYEAAMSRNAVAEKLEGFGFNREAMG